ACLAQAIPGNALLILRRRSANENGENCFRQIEQSLAAIIADFCNKQPNPSHSRQIRESPCHDPNEPTCVAIMPQLFRSLHIIVDQGCAGREQGGNSQCMCVVNVVRSQERCWASSASPSPCDAVALPRRRLWSIFSAAGLAYSRPASTASPKS